MPVAAYKEGYAPGGARVLRINSNVNKKGKSRAPAFEVKRVACLDLKQHETHKRFWPPHFLSQLTLPLEIPFEVSDRGKGEGAP